MLIEKIYKNVYAETGDGARQDDYAISDRLTALLENVKIEELDMEKLGHLLCGASIIGQEQGFVSGFRFLIQLLAEAVL